MHTTTAAATATHIFIFPYPAQGHMLPLLDLTHQLALNNLKITILVTPKNFPILNTLLTTHPNSIQTLVLPFPTHPNLPLGVENVKDIGNAGNTPITISLSKLEGEVINWFNSHPSPPKAIISDFFLGFTNRWAKNLNIPRISFFSSGAFLSCTLYHLLENVETMWNLDSVSLLNIPRSPVFVHHQLPTMFRNYKKGDCDWMFCKEAMLENYKSYGVVFNSYYDLEWEYLDYIKREVGHDRVYSVAPLSSIGLTRANTGSSIEFNWLDRCPDGSVLFVCFGSQKMLTKPQMEALAVGLERSKTRFIWVVKSEAGHMIPDGFEKRVMDRGLVIHGWAPQTEILNHKAVGGFVSHCGWNSLLESIISGVMIFAWPIEADQFVNAKLVVEYMGSAVAICEGGDTVPDPDVLGRILSESLGKNVVAQKEKAELVTKKAVEAVEFGGNSMRDLDALVKELEILNTDKNVTHN